MALFNSFNLKISDENIEKYIKEASILGIISGIVTFLVTLYSIFIKPFSGFNAYNFVDVVLIFLLTYGIYKKNRVAATIMIIYFVWNRLDFFISGNFNFIHLFVGLFFTYYFIKGAIATFYYHNNIQQLKTIKKVSKKKSN